jgi:hypothetical protein
VASDEDLKLSDTLRYYMRDSFAAKQLLYRRLRCLADYEQANKNLDKARTKNKDIHAVSIASYYQPPPVYKHCTFIANKAQEVIDVSNLKFSNLGLKLDQ